MNVKNVIKSRMYVPSQNRYLREEENMAIAKCSLSEAFYFRLT
jgi:hypothetical protein